MGKRVPDAERYGDEARAGRGGSSAGRSVLDLCSAVVSSIRTERRVRKKEEAEHCEPSSRLAVSVGKK